MDERDKIYDMFQSGMSRNEIKAETGLNIKTVRKYVNEYLKDREKLREAGPDGTCEEGSLSFMEAPKYDSSNRKPSKATPEVCSYVKF